MLEASDPVAPTTLPLAPPEMPALRAGAIVLAGVLAVNLGNYVFNVASGRLLGPSGYADVVSLLTLSGLVTLPVGGAQFAIAKHIARHAAEGNNRRVRDLAQSCVIAGVVFSLSVAVLLAVLSGPLQTSLAIASRSSVILAAASAAPAVLAPIILGVAQGLQRFVLLATSMIVGTASRVVLLFVFFAVGFGTAGVIAATVLGGAIAVAVPMFALRRWLVSPTTTWRSRATDWRELADDAVPVVLGLLALTSLTTIDVIVAKAALSKHDAGIYASASLIGRVLLYVPTAITTILLPKVASRTARGADSNDILGASLAMALLPAAFLMVIFSAAPHLLVRIAFGESYAGAAHLVWIFSLTMTLYAIANVVLVYDIARGTRRTAIILVCAALAQGVLFAFVHGTATSIIVTSLAVAASAVFASLVGRPRLVTSVANSLRPSATSKQLRTR